MFTPFDEINQTKELAIIKTMIPYMAKPVQKQLSMMVHYMSFMNSMKVISQTPALSVAETESTSDKRIAMLGALKKYCSKSEQETIDNLLNFISLMDNREIYDKTGILK